MHDVFFAVSIEPNTIDLTPTVSRSKPLQLSVTVANVEEKVTPKLECFFYHQPRDINGPMICPIRCLEHINPFHKDNEALDGHLHFLNVAVSQQGAVKYREKAIGGLAFRFAEIKLRRPEANKPATYRLMCRSNCDLSCAFEGVRPPNNFILQINLCLDDITWRSEKIAIQLGPILPTPFPLPPFSPTNLRTKAPTGQSPRTIANKESNGSPPYLLPVRGRKNFEILKKLAEGLEAKECLANLKNWRGPACDSPVPSASCPTPHLELPNFMPYAGSRASPRPRVPMDLFRVRHPDPGCSPIGPIPFYHERDPETEVSETLMQPLNLVEGDRRQPEGGEDSGNKKPAGSQ